MKIISAGMPKTGTKSLTAALRELGYEVYDAEETIQFVLQEWVDFLEGKTDSGFIKEAYKDIDATVDVPGSFHWTILFKHFPDAKVIVTVRDSPEVWFKSWKHFCKDLSVIQWSRAYDYFLPWMSPSLALYRKFELHCWAYMCSYDFFKPLTPEIQMHNYLKHNAAVRQLVPADQHLEFNVKDGWEPLCKFLNKPVPDTPFPQENVASKNSMLKDINNWNVYDNIALELTSSKRIMGGCLAIGGALVAAAVTWIF